MGIRSQSLTRNRLTIVGSDGRVYDVTKEMVQAYYRDNTNGNAASRRQQLIQWYNDSMVAALGAENVNPIQLLVEFEVIDGGFTNAEWDYTK